MTMLAILALWFAQFFPFPGPGRAPAAGGCAGVACDDFNRSNGALGANWECASAVSIAISSNAVLANDLGYCYWIGAGSFNNDQYGSVVVTDTGTFQGGSAVRMSGTGSSMTGYIGWCIGTTSAIYRKDSGGFGDLALLAQTTSSCANGNTMRLEVSGSNLTLKVNGTTQVGPTSDGSYTTGKPGLSGHTNAIVDGFIGGN